MEESFERPNLAVYGYEREACIPIPGNGPVTRCWMQDGVVHATRSNVDWKVVDGMWVPVEPVEVVC